MDSNDEIDSNSDLDSNSFSNSTKIEKLSLKIRKNRSSTNVVFVSPNELEDWEIDEDKTKTPRTPRQRNKSVQQPKTIKQTPRSRKKPGRPKRKKDQNLWGTDDEEHGVDNDISDDEYFRRLEEASALDDVSSAQKDSIYCDKSDQDNDDEELDEDIFIGQMKTFDFNNQELLNHIIFEREQTMSIDDPLKPKLQFPPSSSDLNCPKDFVLQLFGIYETVVQYHKILRLTPFKIEDFINAMVANENSSLLSELHMALLKLLLREDDAANTTLCPLDQKDCVNLVFYFMDSLTWPELLRLYIKAIDYRSLKIDISDAYPYVTLQDRVNVLTFLLNLIINSTTLRNEVNRENVVIHEDFCRVCHTSGEVLCCDSCSAVYHLECLTPQLLSVPKTTWNCPICVKHKVPGWHNCNFDGDKALVEHKKTPLGTDRFGNTYWLLARRLIVEPRNDNIEYIMDYVTDDDENTDFEPNYESVNYYSTWNSVEKIRNQLSKDWEADLCDVFDSVSEEMKQSMEITMLLTKEGMRKFKKLSNMTQDISVKSAVTDEIDEKMLIDTENEILCNNEFVNDKEIKNCTLITHSGQPVGVLEDQDGLLVRNIDGNTIRVRLSVKTRSNQLDEVAKKINYEFDRQSDVGVYLYRLGDEGDWRMYSNLYSSDVEALSKIQHQEEKDKRRFLGNKYSINENNEFNWFLSDNESRAMWKGDHIVPHRRVSDVTGGPLSMLQCLRLTLQNMEAQMFSSFMCPAWRNERKNWLINIQRTRNASSLADFFTIFEAAIRPCAMKKVWNNSLGYLYLDRITAAEREEEKRLKGNDKKFSKGDSDVVRTRNPGWLKHTIWKFKGEEFRRLSGDGWSWLNGTIAYNDCSLTIKSSSTLPLISQNVPFSLGSSDDEVINICKNCDDNSLFTNYYDITTNNIDNIFKLRLLMLEKVTKDFDFESSKNKLSDLSNVKRDIQTRKKQLEDRLDILVKTQSKGNQFQNRKRVYPSDYSYNTVDKRTKYQNENSPYIGQYDGADDNDSVSGNECSQAMNTSSLSVGSPLLVNNTGIIQQNNNELTTVNQSRISVQNVIQVNNQTINRVVINQNPQRNVECKPLAQSMTWNNQNIKVLNNNQGFRIVAQGNNPGYPNIANKVVPGNFAGFNNVQMQPNIQQMAMYNNGIQQNLQSQQLRPFQPTQFQQFSIQQHQLMQRSIQQSNNPQQYNQQQSNNPQQYNLPQSNNPQQYNQQQYQQQQMSQPQYLQRMQQHQQQLQQLQHHQQLQQPSQQQQQQPSQQQLQQPPQQQLQQPPQQTQYKKLLPVDMQAIQQRSVNSTPINTTIFNHTNTSQQRMPSTPIQGRRNITKVVNGMESKMPIASNVDTELSMKKEMDTICNEIVACEVRLASIEKDIDELNYKINETNIELSAPYKIHKYCPMDAPKNNDSNNDKLLPVCNSYKWPPDSKEFMQSIFLYQKDNIRPLILAAGRIDVPGFDVEKKRMNNVFWPYPTSRPGLSVTWRYQVSRVMNAFELYSDEFELAATESRGDLDIDKMKNYGCVGLSTLALSLKVLWASLRWDDMLANWFDSKSLPAQISQTRSVYKETLPNGDTLERKIINWKPLDKYSSQCSFLLAICVTTKTVDPITGSARSNRSGRQRTVAKYADDDYFTDDGERDSDDSDPNFIPGQSRVGRPRGRRSRGRGAYEGQGMKIPEKKLKEEWKEEESLELWEIRDYIMSVNWRRVNLPGQRNSVVAGILNKRMPPKVDCPIIVPRLTTQMVNQIPPQAIVKLPPQLPSQNIVQLPPKNNLITQNMVTKTNFIDKTKFPIQMEKKEMKHEGESKIEKIEVPKVEYLEKPNEDLPAIKKCIESSSYSHPLMTLSSNVSRNSNVIVPSPAIPVPITDIRDVIRSEPVDVPVSQGRGRGRGKRRSSMSSCTNEIPSDVKAEELIMIAKKGSDDLSNQVINARQEVIDTEIIVALDKADSVKEANLLTKSDAKKMKKERKEIRREKSEENSDSEVCTGSTSPAIDLQMDFSPIVPPKRETKTSPKRETKSSRKTNRKKSQKRKHDSNDDDDEPIVKKEYKEDRVESKNREKKSEPTAEAKELYCLCKTVYDATRGYIGCDDCQNWFHFECVGMSTTRANTVESWKCHKCSDVKNSNEKENIKTEQTEVYCSCKKIYDPTKLYIACDYCDEWYHPQCVGLTDEQATSFTKLYKCPSCDKRKVRGKEKLPSGLDPEQKVNGELKKKLSDLIQKIMKHKDASYFLKPVNAKKYPQYYQVVQSPMDLCTVKANLDKSRYPTLGALKLDMHNIFTACRIYFDYGSQETHAADNLESFFLTELKRIFDL